MDRYKKQNGLDECYGSALIQAILVFIKPCRILLTKRYRLSTSREYNREGVIYVDRDDKQKQP